MKKIALLLLSTALMASTAYAGGSLFKHKSKTSNANGVYAIGVHICSSLECPPVRIITGDCSGTNMTQHWGVCVCDKGYVADGSECKACPDGQYSDGIHGCTGCAAGTYRSGDTDTSCSPCPDGYYCDDGKIHECPAYAKTCDAKGFTCQSGFTPTETGCQCLGDKFVDENGMCQDCPEPQVCPPSDECCYLNYDALDVCNRPTRGGFSDAEDGCHKCNETRSVWAYSCGYCTDWKYSDDRCYPNCTGNNDGAPCVTENDELGICDGTTCIIDYTGKECADPWSCGGNAPYCHTTSDGMKCSADPEGAECSGPEDCGGLPYCTNDGKCSSTMSGAYCNDPWSCGGDAPYCSYEEVCSADPEGALCSTPEDCGGLPYCMSGICRSSVEGAPCMTSFDCSGTDFPYCVSGECRNSAVGMACLSLNECDGTDAPYCVSGKCRNSAEGMDCSSSHECDGTDAPYCSPRSIVCVSTMVGQSCIYNQDCGFDAPYCNNGVCSTTAPSYLGVDCIPGEPQDDSCGGDAPYCNRDTSTCSDSPINAGCYYSSQCGGSHPYCNAGVCSTTKVGQPCDPGVPGSDTYQTCGGDAPYCKSNSDNAVCVSTMVGESCESSLNCGGDAPYCYYGTCNSDKMSADDCGGETPYYDVDSNKCIAERNETTHCHNNSECPSEKPYCVDVNAQGLQRPTGDCGVEGCHFCMACNFDDVPCECDNQEFTTCYAGTKFCYKWTENDCGEGMYCDFEIRRAEDMCSTSDYAEESNMIPGICTPVSILKAADGNYSKTPVMYPTAKSFCLALGSDVVADAGVWDGDHISFPGINGHWLDNGEHNGGVAYSNDHAADSDCGTAVAECANNR